MKITSKIKNSLPDIKTFGCRLNIWESQVISDLASQNGQSDLIIFNTDNITVNDTQKSLLTLINHC